MRHKRAAELAEARASLPFLSDSNVKDGTRKTCVHVNKGLEKASLACTGAKHKADRGDTQSVNQNAFTKIDLISSKNSLPISSSNIRSRITASGMHLRKFSREHEKVLSETEPFAYPSLSLENCDKTSQRSPQNDGGDGAAKHTTGRNARSHLTPMYPRTSPCFIGSKNTFKLDCESPFDQKELRTRQRIHFDSDPPFGTAIGTNDNKKYGKARRSIRAFVTGDANIRLRDFMFDLDMPSLPTPRFANRNGSFSVVSPRSCLIEKQSTRGNCWSTGREDAETRKIARKERSRRRRTTGTVSHRHKRGRNIPIEEGVGHIHGLTSHSDSVKKDQVYLEQQIRRESVSLYVVAYDWQISRMNQEQDLPDEAD
eukprot:CAMPEP_0113525508 /NCGR_PEP_ID=MMETSP0015_2-20120614/204_1 /TAXON_ID=2838 /ORGANISM="Odontella" /LENGTH=369 /DNA_ID=CAMNT_0000423689 /DNA_START=804 /DNA_END=1914 /DNA_ORIENTATION=+ /assembly_acc=CAM_ASM_000160